MGFIILAPPYFQKGAHYHPLDPLHLLHPLNPHARKACPPIKKEGCEKM